MKPVAVVLISVALGACAGPNYRPMIDAQGVDLGRYEADLAQCQQYAGQVAGAATQAAIGAGIGALLSGVLAAAGGRSYDRSASARMGAVLGGAAGGAQGEVDQRDVVRRCVAGRGYRVLR